MGKRKSYITALKDDLVLAAEAGKGEIAREILARIEAYRTYKSEYHKRTYQNRKLKEPNGHYNQPL